MFSRSGRFVDGKQHGHWLTRCADGRVIYLEYDNGTQVHYGCDNNNVIFDWQPCDATDVRFLEIKKGALDVTVCPAPHHSPPRPLRAPCPPVCPRRRKSWRSCTRSRRAPSQSAPLRARNSHMPSEYGADELYELLRRLLLLFRLLFAAHALTCMLRIIIDTPGTCVLVCLRVDGLCYKRRALRAVPCRACIGCVRRHSLGTCTQARVAATISLGRRR
jgi:hypothetical protein